MNKNHDYDQPKGRQEDRAHEVDQKDSAYTHAHAHAHEHENEARHAGRKAEQAPLAGGELDKLVATARAAWAGQTPHVEADSLGRSWRFAPIHEPHPALTVACGDVTLGVLQTAFGADNPSPDPLREAVVDIDKAVPASPQP